MIFIDANIIIRILVGDDLDLKKEAINFIEKNKYQNAILIEDSIIAEIIFVTTSKKVYNLKKEIIIPRLKALINNPYFFHHHKEALLLSLDKFLENNLDFPDCLALSYKESGIVEEIKSYDKKINNKSKNL